MFDLLSGHAGVLADRCHFLLHFSIHLHSLLSSHHSARQGCDTSHGDSLPLLPLAIEPLQEGLRLGEFSVNSGNLLLYQSYPLRLCSPCIRATLHIVQLFVERLERFLQLLRGCLIKTTEDVIDLHGG